MTASTQFKASPAPGGCCPNKSGLPGFLYSPAQVPLTGQWGRGLCHPVDNMHCCCLCQSAWPERRVTGCPRRDRWAHLWQGSGRKPSPGPLFPSPVSECWRGQSEPGGEPVLKQGRVRWLGERAVIPQRRQKFFPTITGKREERFASILKLSFRIVCKSPIKPEILRIRRLV